MFLLQAARNKDTKLIINGLDCVGKQLSQTSQSSPTSKDQSLAGIEPSTTKQHLRLDTNVAELNNDLLLLTCNG